MELSRMNDISIYSPSPLDSRASVNCVKLLFPAAQSVIPVQTFVLYVTCAFWHTQRAERKIETLPKQYVRFWSAIRCRQRQRCNCRRLFGRRLWGSAAGDKSRSIALPTNHMRSIQVEIEYIVVMVTARPFQPYSSPPYASLIFADSKKKSYLTTPCTLYYRVCSHRLRAPTMQTITRIRYYRKAYCASAHCMYTIDGNPRHA